MEPTAVSTLRWIPLLPLLGAVVNGIFGAAIQRRAGKGAIAVLAVAPIGGAFAFALLAFVQLLGLPPEGRMLLDVVWRARLACQHGRPKRNPHRSEAPRGCTRR